MIYLVIMEKYYPSRLREELEARRPLFRSYTIEAFERGGREIHREEADVLVSIGYNGIEAVENLLHMRAEAKALIEGAQDPEPYYMEMLEEWSRRVKIDCSPESVGIRLMGFDTLLRLYPGPRRTFDSLQENTSRSIPFLDE